MQRTAAGELTGRVGEEVQVCGWVDARRDHGKLIFIDLRDQSGKIQLVATPDNVEVHKLADTVRPEWVIGVRGKVGKRPEKMENANEPNGAIEVAIGKLTVLARAETPPFNLADDGRGINEELRLTYRYLDLRRPRLKKNIVNRAKAIKFIRDHLTARGFMEVETPLLTKSTPEGARDYVVPSRLEPGKFYALPQSPQQYKQLLMVAGFERYFQIARCLRDEDTRGDRQPEFTQLDLEMSFVTQEDILRLVEEMFGELVTKLYPSKRLSQKPWPRLDYGEAMQKYGSDRPDLRQNKNDPEELAFAWVLNFPLFEKEKMDGHFAPSHHMFTAPREEDLPFLDGAPEKARSYQHDLILNGFEVGGGSIRIHDPQVQTKIFDLIGFSQKQKDYFHHMLEAFKYGVPPHGGIAPGLDRLLMVLENEPNIREVIAFPKTGEGRDLMMGAPAELNPEQLTELQLKIKTNPNPDAKNAKRD